MDWIEGFVADCQARGLAQHTIESYRSCCKDFLARYPDPTSIGLDELRAYLGELRKREYQGSTVLNYFASLSALFEYMVFDRKITDNPILTFRKRYLRVKNQRCGENTRQSGTIEQIAELINLAQRVILDKTMMLFLAKTGVRRGEFISMDLEDIAFSEYTVSGEFWVKPKPKRSNRRGFMDSELCMTLREYLDWREPRAVDHALWVTEGGHRVSRNYVYYTTTYYAGLTGLHNPKGALNKKFTVHNFRHFFTTTLRRAGMPREFIQELRGDRRKDAVDIYDHVDPLELRRSYLECIPYLNAGPGRPGTLEEWIV